MTRAQQERAKDLPTVDHTQCSDDELVQTWEKCKDRLPRLVGSTIYAWAEANLAAIETEIRRRYEAQHRCGNGRG